MKEKDNSLIETINPWYLGNSIIKMLKEEIVVEVKKEVKKNPLCSCEDECIFKDRDIIDDFNLDFCYCECKIHKTPFPSLTWREKQEQNKKVADETIALLKNMGL